MKKLILAGALFGTVCANATIDEYGMYYPDYMETDDSCYLYFDRAVTCQGLIEKIDPASGAYYYAGMSTLKISKSSGSKKTTKWSQDVILEGGAKVKFSGSLSFCDDGEEHVVKGHTCTDPWVDWFPFCFGSDIDDGSAFGWIVDTKRKELNSINGSSCNLRVYADSPVRGAVPYSVSDAVGQLTLAFGRGGSVKISGNLPGGEKVSAKANLTGCYSWSEGGYTGVEACLPIYLPNKNKRGGLGIDLQLGFENGSCYLNEYRAIWHNAGGADNIVECGLEIVNIGANGIYDFDLGDVVSVAEAYAETLMKESERSWTEAYVLEDFAYCTGVKFSGSKVSVPKAGSVKLQKFKEEDEVWYDPVCTGWDNPVALKLKYNAKTGMITGSASVYIIVAKWSLKTRRVDGDVEEYEVVSPSIKKFTVKFSGFAEEGEIYLHGSTKYGDFGVFGYSADCAGCVVGE